MLQWRDAGRVIFHFSPSSNRSWSFPALAVRFPPPMTTADPLNPLIYPRGVSYTSKDSLLSGRLPQRFGTCFYHPTAGVCLSDNISALSVVVVLVMPWRMTESVVIVVWESSLTTLQAYKRTSLFRWMLRKRV